VDQFCRRDARLALLAAGDIRSISLLLTLHHAAGLAEQATKRTSVDTSSEEPFFKRSSDTDR